MILKPGKLYTINESLLLYTNEECTKVFAKWILRPSQIILLLSDGFQLRNNKEMKKFKILTGAGNIGWIFYHISEEIFSEIFSEI
jgi:hypothetical protein